MKNIKERVTGFAIALILIFTTAVPAMAIDKSTLKTAVEKAAAYTYKTVKDPQIGPIGGEWAVLGLARSGYKVPDKYYQDYYASVEKYVAACKGVLHDKKYTEYSRVIIALTAIGKNPVNVAGYNLLTPLGDYDKTIWQGLNGPIWALIALDSGNYAMPQNSDAKTQATRQMYVDRILSCQLADGGWSLFGGTSSALTGDQSADPDITGMALQALAKYTNDAKVKTAVDKALDCISKKQDLSGGFSSWGTANSESAVQVLVGLSELGISPDDSQFVKNGKSLLDNLLGYQQLEGSFKHTSDGSGSNQMATEQGFYGIVAALRIAEGKSSLYRMSDAISIGTSASTGPAKGAGLEGKKPDVKTAAITAPGTSFSDVVYIDELAAIEALASRKIITGREDGTFAPEKSMTRAEFAAIVVRALGLTPKANGAFTDVPSTEWYAPYIGTANSYGIVNGKSESSFEPEGTITREEAAVMVTRAAKLCGMKTEKESGEVKDTLAQFADYVTASDWARPSLAFCYVEDILSQKDIEIRPLSAITRAEVAQMLFNLLGKANLL